MLRSMLNFGAWLIGRSTTQATVTQPTALQSTIKPKADKKVQPLGQSRLGDDDSSTDPSPDPVEPAPHDALAMLLENLQQKLEHLDGELKHWENAKVQVLGNESTAKRAANEAAVKPFKSIIEKIRDFFKSGGEAIASDFRTGEDQLEVYLSQARSCTDGLEKHLNEQRNILKALEEASDTVTDEIRQVQLDMFDTGIEIWSELMSLTNEAIAEINFCILRERTIEQGLKTAADLILFVVDVLLKTSIRVFIPVYNISFEPGYRVSLEDSIQPAINAERELETTCEVDLELALAQLEKPVFKTNPTVKVLFQAPSKQVAEQAEAEASAAQNDDTLQLAAAKAGSR